MKDDRIKAFLRLLTTNKSSDSFTGRIVSLAEDAKHNTQWRLQYMEWERQRTYDREAGREEGRTDGSAQKAIDDARNLLAKTNLSPEVIAECCSMPLEKVLELKEKVQHA